MFRLILALSIAGSIFWPLCSSVILGFGGAYLNVYFTSLFAISCLFLLVVSSSLLGIIVLCCKKYVTLHFFTCLKFIDLISKNNMHTFDITWGVLYDYLTVIMLIVISVISALVHLFTYYYLKTDPHLPRFYSVLSLFTFFMVMLVTANNFFQLFVGWEGVGICSFLLIGFWYQRNQAVKSALQAVIINKIGDMTLIFAVIFLLLYAGTTSFDTLTEMMPYLSQTRIYCGLFEMSLTTFLGILFFFAAIAKSAQIGLHTWLLSAMEGPTPVSALLHAATMVTAGIFLILRSQMFWLHNNPILIFMLLWGVVTALFAALCGLVQHDIKKIIAFSTCSQLGYMFFICGLEEYNMCLYHLTNHAFFKALLFLGAGSIIHTLNGEQDLRRMGGLAKILPVTYIAMFIASLALLGFPFLSGFYSKDIIIELTFSQYTVRGTFTFWLATSAAFLTAFYSMRLLYWVFLSAPNFYRSLKLVLVEDNSSIMLWAFRPLILGSLFSGYFLRDIFYGLDQSICTKNTYLVNIYGQFKNNYALIEWANPEFLFVGPWEPFYIRNPFGFVSTHTFFFNKGHWFNNFPQKYMHADNLDYFYLNSLNSYTVVESEFLPISYKLMPIFFSLFGLCLAFNLYNSKKKYNQIILLQKESGLFQLIYIFFLKKGFFDVVYNNFIAKNIYLVGWLNYFWGDQGFIEWFGPQGLVYQFHLNISKQVQFVLVSWEFLLLNSFYIIGMFCFFIN